nr:PAS domain S-box protein [uncultured Methanospirillum sp.]
MTDIHTILQKDLKKLTNPANLLQVAFIVAIFIVLYLISTINYILFHGVVELAGIAVAFSIFIIIWNTRSDINDAFFLIVGISFLFIGGIDLVHTLAYKGMGVFPGNSSDLPTQLWIAARYFQSITFLIGALFIGRSITKDRKYDAGIIITACTAACTLFFLSIFVWQNFPHCFIEGNGLTPFKIASEYLISLILIATIIILYLRREHFDHKVWQFLIAAQVFLILGELAFTSYVSVFGYMNLLGHLFRLISVYLFYRAFIVISLTRPYDLLLRDLKEKEDALQESVERFRAVFNQTFHLMGVLDPQGTLVEINTVATEYLRAEHIDPVSELGKPFWLTPWWTHDPAQQEQLKEAITRAVAGEMVRLETTHPLSKDLIHIDFSLKPVRDIHGNTVLLIAEGWDITDRKRAEVALRASEEKYRLIVENSRDLIYMLNARGEFLYASPSFHTVLGYHPDEITGRSFEDLIHPEDLPRLLEVFQRSLEEDYSTQGTEYRVRHASGEWRWHISRGHVVRDTVGNISYFMGIAFDITDRREADEALHRSEQRYREIFDNISEGIYLLEVTEDGRFKNLEVNPALEKSVGIAKSDLIGKYVDETVSPEAGRAVVAKYRRCVDSGKTYEEEIELALPNGTQIFHSSLVPLRSNEGRIDRILGITYDITERRKMEDALRQSEERFRTMSETSLTGIYIFVDGIVKYTNPTFARILGYTPQEMIGMDPLSLVHPEDRAWVRERMAARLNHKEANSVYECRLITKDNRTIFVSIMGVLIPYEGSLAISGNLLDITERKQMEDALRQSEEELRSQLEEIIQAQQEREKSEENFRILVDNAPDAIYIQTNNQFRYLNNAALRLLGAISADQLLGTDFIDRIDPSFHEQIRERVKNVRENQKQAELLEEVYLKLDGTPVYVEVKGVPFEFQGEPGALVMLRDITERKRAEADLIESEERYRTLVETSFDGIAIHRDGILIFINRTCARLLGSSDPDVFIGKPVLDFVAPEYREQVAQRVQQASGRSQELIQEKFRRLDGTIIDVDVSTTPITWKGNPVAYVTFRDITEKKRAEEALRESEQFTREIIQNAKEGIIVYDRDFNYLAWNPFMESFTGIKASEVLGKNGFDLFPHLQEQKVDILLQRALSGETVHSPDISYHIPQTKKSGWVSGMYSPHFNGQGEIIGVIGIIHDISERKLAEEALYQANKKLNLLSSITRHDIGNDIQVIFGYLDFAMEEHLDPQVKGFIEKARISAHNIEEQMVFTRDYQDIGVHSPIWQDVNKVISYSIKTLDISPVQIHIEISGVEIYADPLIEKVFFNLVDNAKRYGETITMIRFSGYEGEEGYTIICEDDGVGIPDKFKSKVFRREYYKHTGFGLNLSREILEITGITITETGVPGKGARFEILVPEGKFRKVG